MNRKYIAMLGNVLNSHDQKLLCSFFNTFCSVNTKLRRYVNNNLQNDALMFSSSTLLNGIEGKLRTEQS